MKQKIDPGGASAEATADPTPNCYGDDLQRRREALGISINKLSKISGVSRRWIYAALDNRNVSIEVLKKVARALGVTEIRITRSLTASVGPVPPALAEALDEISRGTALALQAAGKIRRFAQGVGKSVRNDTPREEGFSDTAASLVRRFTERVRTVSRNREELRKVEEAVSALLGPEGDAPAKAPARRRKRSTA
jgi:transcriptional regulator with XRE-family HTH domain